jgi:hypothetical protein
VQVAEVLRHAVVVMSSQLSHAQLTEAQHPDLKGAWYGLTVCQRNGFGVMRAVHILLAGDVALREMVDHTAILSRHGSL